jgi:CelD/BcsL family acetyltransferase involved in cellulose biosynthesis
VISEFAAAALERGWLRLWTLWLDGDPAAGLMQFLLGGRVSSYYTGFDPRLQREGAGFVLTAHTLRAAIEEGAIEFNMLMGDERWKRRFSTGGREVTTVALVRARHPARVAVGAESAGRRALERLGPEGRERIVSLARPLTRRLPSAWKN